MANNSMKQDTIALSDERAEASYWMNRQTAGDAILLTEEEIRKLNCRMKVRSSSLTDLSLFPEAVRGEELREWILTAQQDFRGQEEVQDLYDASGNPITREGYREALDNCSLSALRERASVRYAVAAERVNIRLLPTRQDYFDSADFRHYDQLQGTALDPWEPVAVLQESRDGAFAFVRSRHYSGWVSMDAMAFTEREKWERYIHPEEFLVVTANQKRIPLVGGKELLFQMGSILPVGRQGEKQDEKYCVRLPISVQGRLQETEVFLPEDDTIHKGWLPCTKNNFLRQAFRFLGDVYGWGGTEDSVDCSSFVGDIYRSMGLEIPRDADQQELALPELVDMEGLSTGERYRALEKVPMGALLFKPGHVMMYLGQDAEGIPRAIHAASSYFTFSTGKGEKHYIRKVLVSDLRFQNGAGVTAIDGLTRVGYWKDQE